MKSCGHPLHDSIPGASYNSKLGDTTSKTKEAFQSVRKLMRKQKPIRKPDSVAAYRLLFEEFQTWRDDLWGNSYSTFSISQTDTIVNVRQLIAKLEGPPHFATTATWYAYTNNFLIVRVCKSHYGENSWGRMWTYYLRKLKRPRAKKPYRIIQ